MDDASLSSPGPLTILEGMRFAGRYELGPEIGRGGMGRVHRARDLVLGEDVALKFLHLHLVDDQLNRKRFLREVRLARHVSHPSVCRVHDVGEADGRLYLSMELVRGRDLAAMLREDGPLELERARRFATQLCAGLAAIHAQGVLHRDLKPGNLLIDAQDGLRITDFGVASLEQDEDEADGIKRGTVTYMAPEQLAGHAPNVQTDLFALGCVLYELYTGEQLYRVQTLDELNARHRDQACRASECRPGIPPDVDARIAACLALDPQQRPRSIAELQQVWPAEDALRQTVAAGRTPSPELVSASTPRGLGLVSRIGLLLAVLIAMFAAMQLGDRARLLPLIKLASSVEQLEGRAAHLATELRLWDPAHREASPRPAASFDIYEEYLHLVAREDDPQRWSKAFQGRPWPIDFWYRWSPKPLVPRRLFAEVSTENPPVNVPGEFVIRLDDFGRLRELLRVSDSLSRVVPAATRSSSSERGFVDWSFLFEAAGLDKAAFEEVRPLRIPPVASQERKAWIGRYGDSTDSRVRVEAAALVDPAEPVAFRVIDQGYEDAARYIADKPPLVAQAWASPWMSFFAVLMLVLAAVLGLRSWRRHEADVPAALRLGALLAGLSFLASLLLAHHPMTLAAEWELLLRAMQRALLVAPLGALAHLGLEPLVRRYDPWLLRPWSQAIRGRLLDPGLRRGVLFGSAVGLFATLCVYSAQQETSLFQSTEGRPFEQGDAEMHALLGPLAALGVWADAALLSMLLALAASLAHTLLRRWLRSPQLALLPLTAAFATLWLLSRDGETSYYVALLATLASLSFAIVVSREGPWAAFIAALTFHTMLRLPMHASAVQAPYASSFVMGLALCLLPPLGAALWPVTSRATPENTRV
jgi:serine/threonine protein kinase